MLNLTRGGLSGGYRAYLRELVPLLRDDPSISNLLVCGPPGHSAEDITGTEVLTTRAGEHFLGFPLVKATVRAWKPDVVLIPTARWMDCGAPCVMMVRNMEPMLSFSMAAGMRAWVRNRLAAVVARRATERAAHVIAVSEFVRAFVVSAWHTDPHRVTVVKHGVRAVPPSPSVPGSMRELAGKSFLLVAGSLFPYRGLEDAVGALARLTASGVRIPLVVAGEGSQRYRARVQRLAERLTVANRIWWVGHLNAGDMAWAFRSCSAFLMTSRIEACPNTVLEAMIHGAVSISSECPPMPEFFGEAASYYAAGNAGELADRVAEVLSAAPEARLARAARARARAEQFTWTETARRTVEALRATQADGRHEAD